MTNAAAVPHNHVLAVIDGKDSVASAVLELEREGFPETLVFQGNELADSVGAQDEKTGNILTRTLKSIPEHLSEESDYLAQYQEECQKGSSVIAVKADRERAQIVRDILERHGGRNARFFGGLVVTDLSAPTNSSAREEVTHNHN